MFRFSLLLSFLLSFISGFSRNQDDSLRKLIISSWELTGVIDNGTFNNKKNELIISFYSDGSVQEEVVYPDSNNWWCVGAKAKWNLKDRTIHLRKIKSLNGNVNPNYRVKFALQVPQAQDFVIILCTRDSIVLEAHQSAHSHTTLSTLVFKPIPLRSKKNWKDGPDDIVFLRKDDSLKKERVYNGSQITLELKTDSFPETFHNVQGQLITFRYDSVSILIRSEHRNLKEHGVEREENNEYKGALCKSFAIDNISFVKVSHPHSAIKAIGGCIVFLSIVSTLIVSPIAASDFTHKRFDAPGFLIYSGISIGSGLLLGIPFLAIGQGADDVYMLDPRTANKDELIWKCKSPINE
jgi:hypothetical protein